MLTAEEKENAHSVQKIAYVCLEAIENEDKKPLLKLHNYLSHDVVLTAPPLAARGIKTFELSGLDRIVSEFGKLFVDDKLSALPGSKNLTNLTARGQIVTYENFANGLRIRGKEFVPRDQIRQTHIFEFQGGLVKRWIIQDEDYLDELAVLFR